MDPKVYVDRIAEKLAPGPSELVGAGIDFFIRTTDEEHKRFVQEFVQRIYDNGDIYEDTYSGLYGARLRGVQERGRARGREVSRARHRPERIEEKNYFFRLSRYQRPLAEV